VQSAPRFLVACFILALLAGCATSRAPRDLPASNASITDFSLAGRVAVKVETRGYSASMRWRHAGPADSLRLLSPVGTTIAQLEADAGGAILTTADKKVYRSGKVQDLTREVLGWDLPLEGLQHWVLGRTDPALPAEGEERDARGRLSRFSQNGWRVSYLAYTDDGVLPARMKLLHERLSLSLVIDRWDIPG
jgi:outer membrane lipoprotein LolB